jgi:hypothetical protein
MVAPVGELMVAPAEEMPPTALVEEHRQRRWGRRLRRAVRVGAWRCGHAVVDWW